MTPGVLSSILRTLVHVGAGGRWAAAPVWLLATAFLTQCAVMPARSHPPRLHPATWSAGDGKSLPYTHWPAVAGEARRSVAEAKLVLVCVHGLSGASSDFWPLGQELPKQGIAIYGMELRGQGRDPEVTARGDIRSRREWMRDLREFSKLVSAEHPGVPVFWLGESLGSLIVLHTVTDGPHEEFALPRGIILLSPAIALREGLPRWKGHVARAASLVAPWHRIPLAQLDPGQVPDMRITSVSTQASQAPLTPHLVPAHSLRLLREVHSLMAGSHTAAARLTLPVLVLYTPNDPVASQRQIERWFDHIDSLDKTPLFFPKDYHLILHDENRWQAVGDIADWLLGHVAKSPAANRSR
jgi:alpha-beta hydrolase superfamily lysophospholipase